MNDDEYKREGGRFYTRHCQIGIWWGDMASIVSEEIDKTWLYASGAIVFSVCFMVSFMLYKISRKEEN